MALTTLTLEVRINFDDIEKQVALREAIKEAARNAVSLACLLQERQVPSVKLYESTINGTDEVDINEELADAAY